MAVPVKSRQGSQTRTGVLLSNATKGGLTSSSGTSRLQTKTNTRLLASGLSADEVVEKIEEEGQ